MQQASERIVGTIRGPALVVRVICGWCFGIMLRFGRYATRFMDAVLSFCYNQFKFQFFCARRDPNEYREGVSKDLTTQDKQFCPVYNFNQEVFGLCHVRGWLEMKRFGAGTYRGELTAVTTSRRRRQRQLKTVHLNLG